MATKTARADFESVFPSLVEDLKEAAAKYKLPQNAMEWFVKVKFRRYTIFLWELTHTFAVAQCEHAWRQAQQGHVGS